MDRLGKVVVASSDLERRRRVEGMLARLDLEPICVSTIQECREILSRESIELVFCDRNFPDGDYEDLLITTVCGNVRVVLMSGLTDAEDYQHVKHSGVFEVIPVSCRPTDVEWMVIRVRRVNYNHTKQVVRGSGRSNDRPLGSMFGN
jgi:DNA-binding NtrC family response regulator